MKKILLTLLLLAALAYPSRAGIFIEVSLDNETFTNITDPTFRGQLNDTSFYASILQLHEETTYFFKAYNSTSNPVFFHQTTRGETAMLSVMIGLILFFMLFLVIAIMIENVFTRLISLMIALGFSWVIYAYILRIAADQNFAAATVRTLEAGYKLMVYSYIVIFSFIGLYMFYRLIMNILFFSKN